MARRLGKAFVVVATAAAIGTAVVVLPPAAAVILASSPGAAVLMVKKQAWGAAVFTVFLAANLPGVVGAWANQARWPVLAAAGGMMLIRYLLQLKKHTVQRAALFPRSFLVLLLAAAASAAWSEFPRLTLARCASLVLGLAVAAFLAHERRLRRITEMGAIALFAGVGIAVAIGAIMVRASFGLFTGPFANQNALGATAALGVPLLVGYARVAPGRRILYWPAASLALGVLLSGSRGGALGMATGCAVLAATSSQGAPHVALKFARGRRLLLFAGPAALLMLVLILRPEGTSLAGREVLVRSFSAVNPDHLALGTGFGTTERKFLVVQSRLGYEPYLGKGTSYHNSYVQLVSELGILGLLSLLWAGKQLWRSRSVASPVALAVISAGLVSALFESWLFAIGSGWAMVFWFYAACILVETEGYGGVTDQPYSSARPAPALSARVTTSPASSRR